MSGQIDSNSNFLGLPNEIRALIFRELLLTENTGNLSIRSLSKLTIDNVDLAIRSLWETVKESSKSIDLKTLAGKIEQQSQKEPNYLQFFDKLYREIGKQYNVSLDLEPKHIPILPSQFATLQKKWQKKLDTSLIYIWDKIREQLSDLQNPPNPNSAAEIKAFLNNPGNAPIFYGITHLELSNSEIEALPQDICNLTQLETLELANNLLTTVPDLSALTQLRNLDISYNKLCLIHSLSALKELEFLNLKNNELMAVPGLENLTELRELYLTNNKFATVPSLGGLLKLERLHMNDNLLTTVPNLERLTELQELDLSNNRIVAVPDLGELFQLTHLSLKNNLLTTIPDFLNVMEYTLEMLSLENNPWMFISKDASDSPEFSAIREQLESQLRYKAKTPLASFYQMIIAQKSEEEIKAQFIALPPDDQKGIFKMVSILSGKAKDLQWGEMHVFDDMQVFYVAVQKAIFTKLERLAKESKDKVYAQVCKLARQKQDIRWGKTHALDNVPLLADALVLSQEFN